MKRQSQMKKKKSTSPSKPRPPLRAAELWKRSHQQLQHLQDEIWRNLGQYSTKLGWGLTGIQPECWTLLDSAIDELIDLRSRYRVTWEQNVGGGRGMNMELAGDRGSVYQVWAKLNKDQTQGVRVVHERQEQTLVRDIHVYWGNKEFDPKKAWPRKPYIMA